jgi:hypothetical protein
MIQTLKTDMVRVPGEVTGQDLRKRTYTFVADQDGKTYDILRCRADVTPEEHVIEIPRDLADRLGLAWTV